MDAEAVLLVDHDQPEVAELDAFLEEAWVPTTRSIVAGGKAGDGSRRGRGRARGR